MAPQPEKSQLKRSRQGAVESDSENKKPRRSERISSNTQGTPLKTKQQHLPSPLTNQESIATEPYKEPATPPASRIKSDRDQTPAPSPGGPAGLSSPPADTQALSQFVFPVQGLSHEIEDEEAEGVWGYLVPLDVIAGDTMVLKTRASCSPMEKKSDFGRGSRRGAPARSKNQYRKEEKSYEESKKKGGTANGYVIGRHPESDRVIDLATVSNRHCLVFPENSHGETIAVLEDLSSNGTFVNEAIIGRNKRRELQEGDEITILDEARFVFRYPKNRKTTRFGQQFTLLNQLGKGHFATVHLCVEKATGHRFAVKIFTKRGGLEDRSKTEGLQQEIAVLMGVSHPNLLCLKDTFDEEDGVYIVLELAAEGELFNWIILKKKLTEDEARRVFIQLFQGMKYLHERNIVHRDIKPENILLVDKNLSVKVADFGLAKIIGEESFTTTLCGTPSYVAPEILQNSKHRRYTRAVDVWSLGVVLYICLCGFPPFSDELNTPDSPYSLSQQILMGRFDYPSPYWDSVGDPALDLIDRMLTVDVSKRITIDECLEHPWLTQKPTEQGPRLTDSTDGLTGAMDQLDFTKRKIARERTLLSDMNDVKIMRILDTHPGKVPPVKMFQKNSQTLLNGSQARNGSSKGLKTKEPAPAAARNPQEFMELGGKGDEPLFGYDGDSNYI